MALLVTDPYDPWKQTQWAGAIIQLAGQLQQHREAAAQQQQEQALHDQRRAFEFDRRLEFDRAKTAADDTRADATLALAQQEAAPFVATPNGGLLPIIGGGSPAANVPTLKTSSTPPASTSIPGGPLPAPDLPLPDASAPADTAGAPAPPMAVPNLGFGVTPATKTSDSVSYVRPGVASGGPYLESASTVVPAATPPPPSSTVPVLPAAGAGAPGLSGEPSLMPPTPIPTIGKTKPSELASTIAELRAGLSGSGISKKQFGTVVQVAASAIAARKPESDKPIVRNFADGSTQQYDPEKRTWVQLAQKGAGSTQTLADVVGDAEFNKEHGTYVRPDGSEFFPNQGSNGRWTVRAYKPQDKPAKILWGDDGQMYPHDSHGDPMRPVPEGVQLRDHSTVQFAKSPGGGTLLVDPDGTTRTVVPDGLKMDAKSQDKYMESLKAVREAQVNLDTQTWLNVHKPKDISSPSTWFGGGTKGAVDEAQKKFDDATKEVESIRAQFPQLHPQAIAQSARGAAGAAGPAGTASPTVTKKEEFDALPSGTVYTGADGKKYRKP